MNDSMVYVRQNIDRLEPYVPGEQTQQAGITKLNTNENPYPPVPAVLAAIRAVNGEALRRYPPPSAPAFRETAASVHGVSPDMVIATNGGDELLRLAVTVFCQPVTDGRGGIAMSDPTYSLYGVLAAIGDSPVMRAALNEDWSLPDDLAERVEGAGCRLLLLVSPHAPSGAARPLEELEAISRRLRGRAVLLIDEAYVDFAEADALPLLHPGSDHDNVLVLRTLSKGYSLAGLRFGYGLGHPDLIAALDKARDSYNTDVLAQAGAVAALQHREDAAETWQAVREERDRLAEALQARGYEVVPSQSNFLLAGPPPTGPDAATIYRSLKRRGVLVRYFDQDRLRDKLRITVGTPQQNDVLLRKLDAE